MILFVMGLPGRFAEWCTAVLVQLAAQSGEAASVSWPPLTDMFGYDPVSSSILEELGLALIGAGADHFVVNARQPDEKLRGLLIERQIPLLVALDEPGAVVRNIWVETGAAPKQIVRALANSYPFLMQCEGLPGALVLTAEQARADPVAAIVATGAHFGFAAAPERVAAIAAELALPEPSASAGPEDDPAVEIPAAAAKMLDGALSAYHRHFLGATFGEIVWVRDLFLDGITAQSPTEPIDVTGGARILIYGPYIQLPPGQWTARIVVGVSPETVGTTFVIDAFADTTELGNATIAPARGGVHAADIAFSLEQASLKGVEVRVMVIGDRTRGRLALGHVVLQLQSAWKAETVNASEDFETVLEL